MMMAAGKAGRKAKKNLLEEKASGSQRKQVPFFSLRIIFFLQQVNLYF